MSAKTLVSKGIDERKKERKQETKKQRKKERTKTKKQRYRHMNLLDVSSDLVKAKPQ